MNGPSHRIVTKKAIFLSSKEKKDNIYPIGEDNLLDPNSKDLSPKAAEMLEKNSGTDKANDLELVDVDAGSGVGRDDPHVHDYDVINDEANYKKIVHFTSFLHFIDLGHKGKYDDYDGYSYHHGSACKGEYEKTTHAAKQISDWAALLEIPEFFNAISTFDKDLNWYLNDEYVHAPGMKWYRNCSPSVWRYTFNNADCKRDQILKRYPLAERVGKRNCGIPYSVFSPVDNLGRFWYERFLISGDIFDLGPVMHAIQDACVPHHSSGYMGNWHINYENCLEKEFIEYYDTCDSAALKLYKSWSSDNSKAPSKVTYPESISLIPNKSWRIDALITWLACQSHNQFVYDYNGFQNNNWEKNGRFKDNKKPRELLDLAVAMSMLVFDKAKEEYIKEKKYGCDKVNSISVTIYAPKSKSYDTTLQMRLFYNYCGGSIDFDLPKNENKIETIGQTKYYKYQKTFDVSNMNVNAKKFRLELERCRLKDFEFYYIISYKTADYVDHSYANTFTLNKLTKYEDRENCITLPRLDVAKIRKINFSSTESKRYNAHSNDSVYLVIRSKGYERQFVQLSPSDRKSTFQYITPVDVDNYSISIAIFGEDAWLPQSISITLADENGNILYRFSKSWPDHLWLTDKSRSKNLSEYLLIENNVDVFDPPK